MNTSQAARTQAPHQNEAAWNALNLVVREWQNEVEDRDLRLAPLIRTGEQAREVCRVAIEELSTFGIVHEGNAAKWLGVWNAVSRWDCSRTTVDVLDDAIRSIAGEHDRCGIALEQAAQGDRSRAAYWLAAIRLAEALLCSLHRAAINALEAKQNS